MDFKGTINNILNKVNFLDYQGKISLTNITVALFVLITAIRSLFGGSILNISTFAWKIQQIDMASVLPVLFSLLNYSHKRHVINQNLNQKDDTNAQ